MSAAALSTQPRAHQVRVDWPATPIPLRMARVMRQQDALGLPTTEDDFLQAEETCDVSLADLKANIGAAKRLIAQGADLAENKTPGQRVTEAASILEPLLPDDQRIFAMLRANGYSSVELGDLWPLIMARIGRKLAKRSIAPKAVQ